MPASPTLPAIPALPENHQHFASQLIDWQQAHGRHQLPWQNTLDPYRIWLSEIMLQQTQVGTVMAYYQRFLERFPTIDSLAAASIDEVLQYWAGLGYYARGRNLHRCAQAIMTEHHGHFPDNAETLATLPGIGRSTAAAIAVFAFGKRAAILDGNAKRVFVRYFGVREPIGTTSAEKNLWQLAEALLPPTQLKAYTQGLMDLGSQVCKRQKPLCQACPLAHHCIAAKAELTHILPLRKPRQALPEKNTVMVFFTDKQQVLLERRPAQGIWGGLLAAPQMQCDESESLAAQLGLSLVQKQSLPTLRHTFTHFRLHIDSIVCLVKTAVPVTGETDIDLQWVSLDKATTLAVPTPVKRLLKEILSTI